MIVIESLAIARRPSGVAESRMERDYAGILKNVKTVKTVQVGQVSDPD